MKKNVPALRLVTDADTSKTALAALLAADLSGLDAKVLMIDGVHIGDHCIVVALGIGADGTKIPLGLWEGATENTTVVKALLADLVERGMSAEGGAVGRRRRRQGVVRRTAPRLRKQCPDSKMPDPQAPQRRRPPAGARSRPHRRQAGRDLRRARPGPGGAGRAQPGHLAGEGPPQFRRVKGHAQMPKLIAALEKTTRSSDTRTMIKTPTAA